MLTSDMTVAQVLETWPQTADVFKELKTACIGCVMAPFDTIEDVARIYELDLNQVIRRFERALDGSENIPTDHAEPES